MKKRGREKEGKRESMSMELCSAAVEGVWGVGRFEKGEVGGGEEVRNGILGVPCFGVLN